MSDRKPWHDCPKCPECGLNVGVAHGSYRRLEADELRCPACGHIWRGTAEEIAQAKAADAAWAAHEIAESYGDGLLWRMR